MKTILFIELSVFESDLPAFELTTIAESYTNGTGDEGGAGFAVE